MPDDPPPAPATPAWGPDAPDGYTYVVPYTLTYIADEVYRIEFGAPRTSPHP